MAAIIKMYTWWTIRHHKKSEEQAYKLIAISRRKTVSGINGNSLNDTLEISPATDQTVRQKIKDGAVVFGIRPSGFAMDFEFKSVQKESVPGVLNAKMHGVFSLNLANPDALGMLLVDLPELCKKSNNEWTAEDLQSLFAEYKDRIEIALRRRVGSSPVTAQELLSVGDSYNYSSEQVFPSWLKVDYLHTKYTYTEADFRAALPAVAEQGKKFSQEAAAWEEEYNRKVEAMERQKAEAELRRSAALQNMDILNREHQIELAKIEGERNFFRKRHPELSEIGDMFKTYRNKTYAAYARIFYYFADHPILTPIILFAALMVYNVAASTIIPLRVQIRIEGNNDTAVSALESEIFEYFKPEKGKIITAPLGFSDADGGRQTEEFLLVRGQIDDFQQELQKSVQNQQQYLEGKVRSTPAHYSFFDGGLNFALKKKVYVFTAKDSEKVANQQTVILIGKNSIESDLKDFLENSFAAGRVDTDNDDKQYPDGIVFCFKLRSGISTKHLSAAITKKFKCKATGSNPVIVNARAAQTVNVVLDVSKLTFTQTQKVEKYFLDNDSFLEKKTMSVPCSKQDMRAKLRVFFEKEENRDISGDWDKDGKSTFIFKPVQVQKKILRIQIDKTTDRMLDDFSKLQKEYGINKKGTTYTLEYFATPEGEKKRSAFEQDVERLGYLKWEKETQIENGKVIIYKVEEQRTIDTSELPSADRNKIKETFKGIGEGNQITVNAENLNSEAVENFIRKTGIDIRGNKAVKLPLRELVVRIQGTPSQTTRDCLNRQGFQTKGDGYYAAGYYTDDDCKTKLSALNKLSPALSLVSYDNNQLVFQQKIYVQWKAPGLPEVKDLLADGYFSEEEINAVQHQQKFREYVFRTSNNADSQTITISKPKKNYQVMFHIDPDDFKEIYPVLRKSFGNDEFRIIKQHRNPSYVMSRVRSDKAPAALQTDIYDKLQHCPIIPNISVLPEKTE